MNFEESSKSYRTTFGFYPTNKNDASEWNIYCNATQRAEFWLKTKNVHSGNVRFMMHDIYKYAWTESASLYDYARTVRNLNKLLPSSEACHSYIMTIIFSLISDDSKIRYANRNVNSKKRQRVDTEEKKTLE